MSPPDVPLLLRAAVLPDGSSADVTISGGFVTAVGPSTTEVVDPHVVDLQGALLLGAFAEPHLHLDKVFTAPRAGADGTLLGAMASYERLLDAPREDVVRRGTVAVAELVRSGVGAVRTHVGCGRLAGVRFVEAMVEVRERVADLIDVQVVAHPGGPGPDRTWQEHVPLLAAALDAGADLLGGTPSVEPRPEEALHTLLDLAVDRGVPVDLHLDETTDPDVFLLGTLVRIAPRDVPITVSHVVSLGAQNPEVIAETVAALVDHRIGVVTLPATNLYLQGRDTTLRGLPPVGRLVDAGVLVAAGSDNVQDPFHPMGRFDPLDTAALLVDAAHLDPTVAMRLVGPDARALMGLPAAGPQVGARADLVALAAPPIGDPVAHRGVDRVVWHGRREVARTTYSTTGPVAELLAPISSSGEAFTR